MFRIGDKVCPRYHMSKVGTIVEMYQRPVTAGNGAGAFSKMWIIKFQADDDQKIYEIKAQDLLKAE